MFEVLPDAGFPHTLGRYQLLSLLGKGGMGSVYLAELHGALGFSQKIALKVVEPSLASKEPLLLLARADEANLLARLSHPNIVGLHGFESIESDRFGTVHALTIEYIAGITLETLLNANSGPATLPLPAIRCFLTDVLAGLEHAHNARDAAGQPLGLVHRDLTPRNFMVDRTGRALVLDFGIAWAVEKLVSTGTGMTKGTPPYMSPEQLAGEAVDPRSDVFVLGAIVYEMILGESWVRRPRGLNDLLKMGRQLAKQRYSDRRADVEAALSQLTTGDAVAAWSDWLEGLLAFKPDQRTPSAAEAGESLAALPGGEFSERGRTWLARAAVSMDSAPPAAGADLPRTLTMPGGPADRTGVTDPDAVQRLDPDILRALRAREPKD